MIRKVMRNRGAVVVAHHIPREGHIALPRKGCRARLPGIERLIFESPVRPMSVRTQDSRQLALNVFGLIQIVALF